MVGGPQKVFLLLLASSPSSSTRLIETHIVCQLNFNTFENSIDSNIVSEKEEEAEEKRFISNFCSLIILPRRRGDDDGVVNVLLRCYVIMRPCPSFLVIQSFTASALPLGNKSYKVRIPSTPAF